MVTGISVGQNSSDDEEVIVKRRSIRKNVVDSDDETSSISENSSAVVKEPRVLESDSESLFVFSEGGKTLSRTPLHSAEPEIPKSETDGNKKKRWKILMDSDCSSDEEPRINDYEVLDDTQVKGALYDEKVSEDEVPRYNSEQSSKSHFTLSQNRDLYDAEGSEDEVPSYNSEQSSKSHFNLSQNNDLYDAEGSEDDAPTKSKPKVSSKRRSQTERKSKSNAVQQIHSETQRLVRESRVSLPYHKPRQRSLTEFLQRRSTTPSTTSLKMSSEDLRRVWKQLEEKEKEVEEFYKSESDESDNDGDTTKNESYNGFPYSDATKPDNETTSNNDHFVINEENNNPSTNVNERSISPNKDVNERSISPNKDGNERSISPNKDGNERSISPNKDGNESNSSNNDTSEENVSSNDVNERSSIHDKDDGSNQSPSNVASESKNPTEDVLVSSSGTNILISDTGVCSVDISREVSNSLPLRDTAVHNSETDISASDITRISSEIGDSNSVSYAFKTPRSVSNVNVEDSNCATELADSCDFHLHYSESESMDSCPNILARSSFHDDESNAMDIRLERLSSQETTENRNVTNVETSSEREEANTEDLHLHYTETQDEESSPMVQVCDKVDNCEEHKEQKKEPWWENLQPPSPEDDEDEKEIILQPPSTEKEYETKTKTVLQRLARRTLPGLGDITKIKPRLSGGPNEVIELDDEETGRGGVVKLVERFLKHSAAKRPVEKKHPVEIGVVTAEKGPDGEQEVHKELVTVILGGDEPEDDPLMAKPGAKLQRLKKELQHQMAQRRAEEWGKRLQENKLDNEELEGELSDCGGFMGDENEPEAEMTETETESEEEEEEEAPLKEKKRVKSAFLDDEADVSDDIDESSDEDDELESAEISNSKLQESKLNELQSDDDKNDDDVDENEEYIGEDDQVATSGEVVNGIEKSSEEGQLTSELQQVSGETAFSTASPKKTKLERAKTLDMFASQEDFTQGELDLAMIPPYQPFDMRKRQATPSVDAEDNRKSRILDLISPVSNLPSLRSTPSTQSEYPSPLTARTLNGTSSSTAKKLFTEAEPMNTQDNMDELLGLCSGQFTGSIGRLVDPSMDVNHKGLEDELLGLCSGKFNTQPVNLHSLEQDEGLTQPNTQHTESPSKSKQVQPFTDDEEDEVVETRVQKRHKRLDFSDESDDEDAGSDVTAEVEDEDEEPKLVDYDSEENEIIKPAHEPKKRSAAEFFEDEAELSESEWGSEDEDEQDLDTLEFEEGDAENLDQRKVKAQLDKIHMRRLLDEDRREVRMLQELLLEDGELHSEGGGRERKFRWKNINNVDDNDLQRRDSDNEGNEDVENEDEETWRRLRHEREMFLQQHKMKAGTETEDVLSETSDSQLIKLGRAALKRINSQDKSERLPPVKRTVSDPLVSPDPKHPFKLLTKRGSFLARGENALARIAEITQNSSGGPVVGPKNTRNFVFATLSPEKVVEKCTVVEEVSIKVKKRKQDLGVTPPIVKKLRLSDEHSRGRRLLDLLT